MDGHPKEVLRYIDNGYLDLSEIRETCNFLTDPNIQVYNGDSIPRRKNAFVRHIKQISNSLETAWESKTAVNDSIVEMLYEIALFQSSLQEKTFAAAHAEVKFDDQFRMWFNTKRSTTLFSVAIPTEQPHPVDPQASPFWHPAHPDIRPEERFDQLAKLKKIKAKKKMVVIFDDLSYDGSAPKINTLDLDMDNGWVLKWGDEVHTDVICSRLFAALGYDVDHPYYYGKDSVTLIFPQWQTVQNPSQLTKAIADIYDITLDPFISQIGLVDDDMTADDPDLLPYIGSHYITFVECALEARPDRVKRIGSFVPNEMNNDRRRALRGALLAHAWIGNWDTRESNTLLTQVHMGNYQYRMSAVFSDLGTSMGVNIQTLPPDFKTGMVNTFGWEVLNVKFGRIFFNEPMNALLSPYTHAQYSDLLWMAQQIAKIDAQALQDIVEAAHYPEPLAKLYYYKLASRRANILEVFQIKDPHPIFFDEEYSAMVDGKYVVRYGELMVDINNQQHPESFMHKEGRFRNYGH